MLRHTFCHIPGVGPTSEKRLWAAGVHHWDDVAHADLPGKRGQAIRDGLQASKTAMDAADPRYFAQHLPTREQWRMFADFKHTVAYLDIETTGLGNPDDYVTTIALYDGQTIRHYVRGENLGAFEHDASQYDLLVTYNGKSFDLPFLRKFMGVHLDPAHIDLMHVLRSLSYRGGLKSVEHQLGYGRPGMEDVDGFFAVVLWHAYRRTDDRRVLDTLLAYNIQDVLTLEVLMAFAYNRKLQATPFAHELALAEPPLAANPFQADQRIVRALRTGRQW